MQASDDGTTPASRAVKVAAALLILNMVMAALLLLVAFQNRANGRYIKDCTTAGTHQPTKEDPTTGHRCYDEGTSRSGAVLSDLRKSIDCVALYDIHERPAACVDVAARMDSLAAGGNPFAPTTTSTTVPKRTR